MPCLTPSTFLFYNSIWDPVALVVLDDLSGNGAQELGVLGMNNGTPRVQIRDTATAGQLHTID